MKLKQILEIQKTIEGKLPVDMYDKWVYYSDSKEDWIDMEELDVVHLVRIVRKSGMSYKKYIGEKNVETDEWNRAWCRYDKSTSIW